MNEHQFLVTETGERLDKLLTALLSEQDASISRVRVQQIIKDGAVTINGKMGKASNRVEAGDQIIYPIPDRLAEPPPIVGEAIPLEVVYEDDDLAAVNKPAGMVVHPALGHPSGTLVNAVLGRWPETALVGEPGRAGIVHRLDKDTSGVILIAKTEAARRSLLQQFKARKVQKRYLALVWGAPETETGEINAPIGRDSRQRKKMAVVRDGRESVTVYHVLRLLGDVSYLELFPRTGRTHQLRVHLAFIKHPVVGDTVYGRRGKRGIIRASRQYLHAASLTLSSPTTGLPITVQAPLPPDMQAALDSLEKVLG